MAQEDTSPDPDVTIRSPRLSIPQFSGIPLPSPLRELQRRQESAARASSISHPSEFTALAVRLRKIHLNSSPSSDQSNTPFHAKPTKLQFDDEDPSIDKENVDIGTGVIRGETESKALLQTQQKESSSATSLFSKADASESADEVVPQFSEQEAYCHDVEQEAETNDGTKFHVEDNSVTTRASKIDARADITDALCAVDEPSIQTTDFKITEDVTAVRSSYRIVADNTEHAVASTPVTNADTDFNFDHPAEDPDRNNFGAAQNSSDLSNHAIHNNQNNADEYLGAVPLNEAASDNSELDATVSRREESESVLGNQNHSVGHTGARNGFPSAPTDNSHREESRVLEEFEANLKTIIEGQAKWPWQKRCEATSKVSKILSNSPSKGILSTVHNLLPTLSVTIINNLDELRPSIMASALNLVNAIVGSKADLESDFAEQVFPSIMDLACGRSITSQESARCLALVLDFHPELSKILEEADNPDRLGELLKSDEKSEMVGEDVKLRARNASTLFQKVLGGDEAVPTTEEVPKLASAGPGREVVESPQEIRNKSPPARNPSTSSSALETPSQPTQNRNARFSQRLNAVTGTPLAINEGLTPKSGNLARRSLQFLSSGLKGSPRHSIRLGSEGHPAAPVVRNMKLGDSVRKISPGSRKKRIYSEEDMEEARRAAMRVVAEEVSQANAKEREKLQKEKSDLERRLTKEKSDVADLKVVLEEFELTMQKMVAQGNTQASAYCATLEKETKKLKAELLEATEAYENVKERYDAAKQTLKVFENKEGRSIEQIRELKKNMAELQKWSNDLKANSEKKLAKAFQSVTSYRASFLDMEAHLSKANSDLERTKAELEKEVKNHAKTAAALVHVEASLHNEQDNRSSLEASLSSSKSSLSRLASQKERLQEELSEAQEELKNMSAEFSRLKDADARAQNASKQLETYAAERQSLKARAYDDMNRIRELESLLETKDKEYNELNVICEEALSQLENLKHYN